jgi:hypothetical protein
LSKLLTDKIETAWHQFEVASSLIPIANLRLGERLRRISVAVSSHALANHQRKTLRHVAPQSQLGTNRLVADKRLQIPFLQVALSIARPQNDISWSGGRCNSLGETQSGEIGELNLSLTSKNRPSSLEMVLSSNLDLFTEFDLKMVQVVGHVHWVMIRGDTDTEPILSTHADVRIETSLTKSTPNLEKGHEGDYCEKYPLYRHLFLTGLLNVRPSVQSIKGSTSKIRGETIGLFLQITTTRTWRDFDQSMPITQSPSCFQLSRQSMSN